MDLVTADDHARIKTLFDKLDADSDGDLTVTELTKMLGAENKTLGFDSRYFMDWYDGRDATMGQFSEEEFRYYLGDLASAKTAIDLSTPVSTQKLNLAKILDRYFKLFL